MVIDNEQYNIAQVPYTGSMSFSGADYKAVIFLPLAKPREYITRRRAELAEQIWQLEETISRIYSSIESFDARILVARTVGNYTLANSLQQQKHAFEVRNRIGTYESLNYELEIMQKELQRLGKIENKDSPGVLPIVLGDLQTFSISSHREKMPVRTLGRIYPHSYTRGPRTVAGSMIFTVMNKHALFDLVENGLSFQNTGVHDHTEGRYPDYSAVLVDQLPPFDVTIIGSNEVGDTSFAVLYGVELVNEGQTLSIEDLITECVIQFVARDYEPLRPVGEGRAILNKGAPTLTATQVLKQANTQESKDRKKKRAKTFI